MNDEAQLAGILATRPRTSTPVMGPSSCPRPWRRRSPPCWGRGGGRGRQRERGQRHSDDLESYNQLHAPRLCREYELEADEVGLRYAKRAGYDPRRMVAMLRWMRRNDMLRAQRLYHGFDATHPDTAVRIAKADTMANLLIAEGGRWRLRATSTGHTWTACGTANRRSSAESRRTWCSRVIRWPVLPAVSSGTKGVGSRWPA